MRKTRTMEWAEARIGGSLEAKLPELFEQFKTTEAVAEHIGIHRVTLAGWLDNLDADVQRVRSVEHRTIVSFPNRPPVS